jgi:hypothetical protein
MSLRRPAISWAVLSRSLRADRAPVVPGFLAARNRVAAFAGFRKTPLVVAGQYDRKAIMTLAADAARDHQTRYGGTWSQAMSVCLRAAWQAAKTARAATAH